MYGYGYRYNSGLVVGAGGGAPFANTYSLSFDGVDDYVIAPLDGTTTGGILPSNSGDIDLTISIWFNKTTNTSMFQWADTLTSGIPMVLIAGTSTGYRILLNNAYQFTGVVAIGDWVNVIIIRNSSTNVWTHYLNGVAIQTYNDGGTLARRLNATDIYLGNGYSSYFNGLIDEVSIWNSDQSANIATLSASPAEDLISLNPTLWLRMGDNGSYKSPQFLIPNNENKDKVSNYSFQLDGVDDYLSVSDNSIGQTQNISYSIWVNLDVTTRQYIIGNQSSSNGGCGLQIESGDALVFQMADGGNDSFFNSRVSNFSTYAPINTWNHILATWDGTDSKIYINGVLRNTWSPTLPYTISGYNTTFNIGWRNAGFTLMTNGKLDELALFDSAISIGDVWDGSGQPIDVSAVSGITNNWRMGEDSTFSTNWTIPDNVGTSTGTSANMTIEDRVGDAPNSENNALSLNMDEVDRTTDVPT